MYFRISFFVVLAILPFLLTGQTNNQLLTKKEARKARPSYITIGGGSNYTSFRDFATSPLFYNGPGGIVQTSILNTDQKVENELGFIYSGSAGSASPGTSYTQSTNLSFYFYYSSLYQIKSLSTERFNLKAGGMANLAMNVRMNEDFMNNAYGYEFIPTLFGSTKATLDISRKTAKDRKLWFIKYHLDPRKMSLSYHLNVGLLNSSIRNGYVYNGQSALLNDWTLLDGYEFNIFSGFRMNSSVDFTYYLKNSNALKLSYLWDAYKTGGQFDKFEFASHSLSLSLLFSTK